MKGPRQRRFWKGLSVALALWLGVSGLGARAVRAGGPTLASESPTAPGVHVVSVGLDDLILEYTLPPISVEEVLVDGQHYTQVQADGLEIAGEAGQPALPSAAFWVGLPPEGSAEVVVLDATAHTVALSAPLLPVPAAAVEEPVPEGLFPSEALRARTGPDSSVYGVDALFPGTVAEIQPVGWIRSQRVGILRLFPVQVNPARSELILYDSLRIQLRFPGAGAGQTVAETAPFEALLRALLLNADQARLWRARTEPIAAGVQAALPGDARFLQLLVDHDGLYRLDAQQLEELGLPLEAIDPRLLHLLLDGVEVPLWIPGEADGVLEPDESIYFYGEASRSRYARTNVYWLTLDVTPGQRMPVVSAQPSGAPPAPALIATRHAEENHLYASQLADQPGSDPWFWTYLYTLSAPQRTFDLVLDDLGSGSFQATLRLYLRSSLATGLNPDHHAQVFLNDTFLTDIWWNDRDPALIEAPVPEGLLHNGTNTVRLVAAGDTGYTYDLFYVDWIELRYPRQSLVQGSETAIEVPDGGPWALSLEPFADPAIVALAVKDPRTPLLLTGETEPVPDGFRFRFESVAGNGAQYLVLSLSEAEAPAAVIARTRPDLLRPRGADYLVIAPGAFFEAIRPLLDVYEADGLRTALVDVQEIYDAFSYGRPDPEAIRAFIAYAYAHWTPPAPTYVLLVGDGHYDFRDNLGYGQPNWIPPYLAYVDPWIGESLADNRYVSVVGDDPLADLLLGRLPVNTPDEVAAVVQKTLALRAETSPQPWHSRVLFIADNPDSSGNFPALSDHIASSHLPDAYTADKVYLGINYPYQNPALAARSAILQAIDEGRLVANYIGHAGVSTLAGEQMLRTVDVQALANGPRFPLLLVWACYAGRYGEPDAANSAITEIAVRTPERGAVAAWGSSGVGLFWTHQYMNEGVFDAFFEDGIANVGAALLAGNLRLYAAAPSMGFELDEFVLLGDPAVQLPLLPTNLTFSDAWATPDPVAETSPVTITLRLKNQGPAPASDVRLSLLVPDDWTLLTYKATGLELTLISPSPPVWSLGELAAEQGGEIAITLRAGTLGWLPVTALLETSTPETTLDDNRVQLDVQVVPPPAAYITLQVEPGVVLAGTEAQVRIVVQDAQGRPAPDGTAVRLEASAGTLDASLLFTHGGIAQAKYRAPRLPGTVKLVASTDHVRAEISLPVTAARTSSRSIEPKRP